MTNANFNVNVLIEAAQDYLAEENEQRLFLRGWTGGWWENLPAKAREDYTKHSERVNCKWDTVRMMCQMVDVDIDKVISTAKAMNRYAKRERWQVCAHIDEKSALKFFANTDGWGDRYYTSTGRKISA
jgi:hypothetical protein